MHKIGFIGGGKIAQAMAKGFIASGMFFFIQLKHGCCTILYHDCKPSAYMVNLLKTSREKWLSCNGYMKSIY